MVEPERTVRLAVKGNALYVFVFGRGALGFYCECTAVAYGDVDALENRRADGVFRSGGAYGVESHCAEYIPGRHLPGVVVAAEAAGSGEILGIKDMAHVFLRLPGLGGMVEEPRHLVAGFVAVPVASVGEHRVEPGLVGLHAAHGLHQSRLVVGHIPCVVAGSSLGDGLVEAHGVGFLGPAAVGVAPAGIARGGVDYVTVVLGAAHKSVGVAVDTERACHLRQTEIVEGVFKRAAHLFALVVGVLHAVFQRDVTIL